MGTALVVIIGESGWRPSPWDDMQRWRCTYLETRSTAKALLSLYAFELFPPVERVEYRRTAIPQNQFSSLLRVAGRPSEFSTAALDLSLT
jgi:hypothetical protein